MTDPAATNADFVWMHEGPEEGREARRRQVVERHLPLVTHLAGQFRGRGEPFEDLVQVGTIGLLKAVDRFDVARGVEFSTFATPTIIGEIKRHFRDRGWMVRVPRRLQELRAEIMAATSELTQVLGRAPRVSELAQRLGVARTEVAEALDLANAYAALSIDAATEDGSAMLESLGADDSSLEKVEVRESLRPLLAGLEARDRRILQLRFFAGMTQTQIAADIGTSQMHVSRLLARALATLRRGLLDHDAAISGRADACDT